MTENTALTAVFTIIVGGLFIVIGGLSFKLEQ